MPEVEDRDILVRESAEYRTLLMQHRGYEERLEALQRKPFLSSQEQVERSDIKKHKLRLRDRMEELARGLRPGR